MDTRVVDIHAHLLVPAVETLVADRPERAAALSETDRERIRGANALEMLTIAPPA